MPILLIVCFTFRNANTYYILFKAGTMKAYGVWETTKFLDRRHDLGLPVAGPTLAQLVLRFSLALTIC